jgi:hypothetical protein
MGLVALPFHTVREGGFKLSAAMSGVLSNVQFCAILFPDQPSLDVCLPSHVSFP